jgi:hypothetical protein
MFYKCIRYPRFAKIGINFSLLTENINLANFGGNFSEDEIFNMIMSFGETDNLMNGGWILQNGEVLDFKRSDISNYALRHSRIYSAFSSERKNILEKYMTANSLLNDDNSIAIDVCLAAGMIRYHFSERFNNTVIYLSIEKKPTNNQLTILKDLADEVGKTVCSKFNGIFECNGTHFSYDDPKKFKYNFLNDLMNCF